MTLAEKVFSTLQKEDAKHNILDIENELSQFANKILIVLESPSTFTELGAFSHKKLRNNIIVINDSKYRDSNSFIRRGPLKAIEDDSGGNKIIHYRMNEDGVERLDSIGDVFAPLSVLLQPPKRKERTAISLEKCNPGMNFDKMSAMMIHDLVYFSGPILHKELVEVLKLVFGEQPFKAKEHLAILVAIGSLSRTEDGLFKSMIQKPYYEYKFDINNLISIYRNYMHKSNPERFYGP